MKKEDEIKQQLIAELEKFCRRVEGKTISEEGNKKKGKNRESRMAKTFRQGKRLDEGIAIIQDGIVKFASPGWTTSSAYQGRELIGISEGHLPAYGLSAVYELCKKYNSGCDCTSSVELEVFDAKKEKKFIELKRRLIPYDGRPAVLFIVHDITDRKETEEKLRLLLKEKEVMMRELHHRVKNNMQIVSSLLRLQSRHFKNRKIIEMFRASQTRIRSMALIHEVLYRSENLAKIDFVRYVETLAVHLFHSYKVDMDRVRLIVDAEDVFLEIHAAISLGLIVNELVSNSLMHAFPDGKEGEICIHIEQNKKGRFLLEVIDSGVGIPDGLNIHKKKTLGMQLVTDLTRQIEGTIEFGQKKEGTSVRISF